MRKALRRSEVLTAILPSLELPPQNQRFTVDLHVLCALIVSAALAAAIAARDGLRKRVGLVRLDAFLGG